MGTGKTTAGQLVAEELDMPFIDLDRRQEAIAGLPIARIFDELGEPAFRDIERRALLEAVVLSRAVIACGGGAAPLHPEEYAALVDGAVAVVLTSPPDEIERRVGDARDRPLLTSSPGDQIRTLLAEREDAYAAAGEPLDTSEESPEQTAEDLVTRYRRRSPAGEPVVVNVETPGHGPVVIGPGVLSSLGEKIAARMPDAHTAVVIADPGAHDTAAAAADSIGAAVKEVVVLSLPGGEEAKTLPALGNLLTELREHHVEPTDVVVAVGGGAVLDAAGFAAATYARGIALVNVPTTLLGMVDASLGGKVAIDHAGAKNLVGTFHPPRLVLADPETLGTLPDRELRTGLAEIVKAAILASPLLLHVLETEDPTTRLEWLVEQAVRIKAGYVAADPRDRGVRRSLNLGHTFAHAIEAASGYSVGHGEAVASGLVAAARLGTKHGITDPDLEERLRSILETVGLPVAPPPGLDPAALLDAVAADKKRRSGRAAFVVPSSEGAALLEGIDPAEALAFLSPAKAGERP
jgi:3-dehydroquinate synthase